MRWRSRSMSSTLTGTTSPMARSRRMVDVRPESSEMWIRPSMPSRSTKAPKSTMLEIAPRDHAGLEAVQDLLADLLALLLEHGAPREHHVVARAVELDHLALDLGAEELVEILHAPDVDQRGGQEAAYAEVDDQTALHDPITLPRRARRTRRRPRSGARPSRNGRASWRGGAVRPGPPWSGQGRRLLAHLDLVMRIHGLRIESSLRRRPPRLVSDATSTSSWSICTTRPDTTSPSSNSTMVAS